MSTLFAKETSKTVQQTTLQMTFVVLGALWVKIGRTVEQSIPIHLIILMHLSVEPSTETAGFATYGVQSGTNRLGCHLWRAVRYKTAGFATNVVWSGTVYLGPH